MASAKNKVIAGEYEGKQIMVLQGVPQINISLLKSLKLDNSTVAQYELITDEHRKSAVSGAARGLVGGALLGPVGLLAGGLSAKSKGIYQIAIQFQDGTKSLIEVNDKIYKALIKSCFN